MEGMQAIASGRVKKVPGRMHVNCLVAARTPLIKGTSQMLNGLALLAMAPSPSKICFS